MIVFATGTMATNMTNGLRAETARVTTSLAHGRHAASTLTNRNASNLTPISDKPAREFNLYDHLVHSGPACAFTQSEFDIMVEINKSRFTKFIEVMED